MNTMPTYDEVLENGAIAADFIPDTGEFVDKIAQAVQADIDDKDDTRDAHIIAEGIIEDAELVGCFLSTDERDAMLEAFVQSVAEGALSISEASGNLDKALLRHFERQGKDYD